MDPGVLAALEVEPCCMRQRVPGRLVVEADEVGDVVKAAESILTIRVRIWSRLRMVRCTLWKRSAASSRSRVFFGSGNSSGRKCLSASTMTAASSV